MTDTAISVYKEIFSTDGIPSVYVSDQTNLMLMNFKHFQKKWDYSQTSGSLLPAYEWPG